MNVWHKELSDGRWKELSLVEQMANIGSDIERALKWKEKNNSDYCIKAFERALELLDLTLDDEKNKYRLKEIARVREILADYFWGENQFHSSADFLRKYFFSFAYFLGKSR